MGLIYMCLTYPRFQPLVAVISAWTPPILPDSGYLPGELIISVVITHPRVTLPHTRSESTPHTQPGGLMPSEVVCFQFGNTDTWETRPLMTGLV